MIKLKEHIEEKGYYITKVDSQKEFIKLCNSLGDFSENRLGDNKLKLLKPLDKSEANSKSLSSIYGLEAFPFHTDGAHKLVPPRYLAFRYIGNCESPEPTLLIDFKSIQLTSDEDYFVNNRIWKVDDGVKVLYRSIKDKERNMIRYDLGCMKLLDEKQEDERVLTNLIDQCDITSISWELNKTMIIDNWRLLHSRPRISEKNKEKRILQRLNII